MKDTPESNQKWTSADHARLSLAKALLGQRIALRSAQYVSATIEEWKKLAGEISEIKRINKGLSSMDIAGIENVIQIQSAKVKEERTAI
ncbi:MAG: hypothetical protein ACHP65_08920 [Legionellales bacterium]